MPTKIHTSKVLCYIVRDGQLLVFRHADYDLEHVGIQVPAGSIRHGESPEDAALREAREETRLPPSIESGMNPIGGCPAGGHRTVRPPDRAAPCEYVPLTSGIVWPQPGQGGEAPGDHGDDAVAGQRAPVSSRAGRSLT